MAPRNLDSNYGSINSDADSMTAVGVAGTGTGTGIGAGEDTEMALLRRKEDGTATSTDPHKGSTKKKILMTTLVGIIVVILVIRTRLSTGGGPTAGIGGSTSSTTSSTKTKTKKQQQEPFSIQSPQYDLGLHGIQRTTLDALPSSIWGDTKLESGQPLPTNSWYQNLVSQQATSDYPSSELTRVYTIPYIVDMVPVLSSSSESNARSGIDKGIRIHWPVMQANDRNMQMIYDDNNGLSLGTITTKNTKSSKKNKKNSYMIDPDEELSLLGVNLKWFDDDDDDNSKKKTTQTPLMATSLVRGMPTTTMRYYNGILPSIASGIALSSAPTIDGGTDTETTLLECMELGATTTTKTKTTTVNHELLLHFKDSDFTWAIFFSKPVQIQCYQAPEPKLGTTPGQVGTSNGPVQVQLNVVNYETDETNDNDHDELVVRVALINQCTTGKSDIMQHCRDKGNSMNVDSNQYLQLLRQHTSYPKTPKFNIQYDYTNNNNKDDDDSSTTTTTTSNNNNNNKALLTFDWDVQTYKNKNNEHNEELLMFGLPHHQEQLVVDNTTDNDEKGTTTTKIKNDFCIRTFHGMSCLLQGNTWTLKETLEKSGGTGGGGGGGQSFVAERPPASWAIPDLAKALTEDINYQLSDNLMRGAADTYFSGKLMARLGRVIELTMEMKALQKAGGTEASSDTTTTTTTTTTTSTSTSYHSYEDVDIDEYRKSVHAAQQVTLPTDDEIQAAIEMLQKGVEIWVNGNGEAPYLYDTSWGGIVNCGCTYKGKGDKGTCTNAFPDDCPALTDVNEDFGNGYYNDHHFHYGYHIYAAAVAAKYDTTWATTYFQDILLYIRDIANPSTEDPYFTQFRQKDWFLGSSWASGIISGENSPHGRNEESSSEAIAAYEAIALYGAVMVDVFKNNDPSQLKVAESIRNVGELLTVSEVHAANRYWHVWQSPTHNNTYPKEYKQPVVGMLYQTMASFQTWFGPEPFYSYGIQLLPLTAVGEIRDDPDWATELYPLYDKSCHSEWELCSENGWTIIQYGLLATTGHREEALERAMLIPDDVFASQGGVGNSRSNTIWYIATRKPVDVDKTNTTTTTTRSSSSNNSSNSTTIIH